MTPHATACTPRYALCLPPPNAKFLPSVVVEVIGEVRAGLCGVITHYHVATVEEPGRVYRVPASVVQERVPVEVSVMDDFLAKRARGERG